MKIAVTNAVLSNSGDAAIFEAILSSLGAAGVAGSHEIIVFDANAKVTSKLYPEWTVLQQLTVSPPRRIARIRGQLQKLRLVWASLLANESKIATLAIKAWPARFSRFAQSYRALAECDVVISSGGTYLVDHYNFDPRVTELQIAKKTGARVYLWTQSLGPFKKERALTGINRISDVVDGVFFRDDRSRASWEAATAMPQLARVVPDVVFALTVPTFDSSTASSKPRRALLSVREWAHGVDSADLAYGRYESMFRSGAAHLGTIGWESEALSTCQGVPSYAYDDSRTARRIFRDLDVRINPNFHSPQALLRELASSDLVITTRMHLAILAILSRKPVIAIAYEFKTLELFNNLGLGRFVVKIEDADESWLTSRIDEIVADPSVAVLAPERLRQVAEEAASPAFALLAELRQLDGTDQTR